MDSGPRSSAGAGPPDAPAPRRTGLRRGLLSYGLYVETLLALVILALAVVTTLVVIVGAITALPTGPPPEGETGASGSGGILGFGTTLVNGTLLLTVGLGALLLVHAAAELWTAVRTGRGFGAGDGTSLAYAGIRTVQTVGALAFVGPIVVGVALSRLGIVGDAPSNGLLFVLLLSGLAMLASVLAHAVGRGVRSLTGS